VERNQLIRIDLVAGSSTKGNDPSDFTKWGISLSAE